MEIADQPASSSMAPRARSSQDENTRARWKKRERTPGWCATHWRLASIFLRLCSRNDFASPSASHPCAHAFQVYPTINPFLSSSFRRCSIPCFRLVTTFHFLVPRYHATFYHSSSSRNVLSLFTRFRPRFYLLPKRSFQANLYFYESIKSLCSFNRVNLLFLSPIFVFVRNFDGTSSFSDLKEPRFTFSTRYDSSLLSFRIFHRRPFSLSAKYLPLETQIDQKLPLSLFTLAFHPSFPHLRLIVLSRFLSFVSLAKRHPLSVRTM